MAQGDRTPWNTWNAKVPGVHEHQLVIAAIRDQRKEARQGPRDMGATQTVDPGGPGGKAFHGMCCSRLELLGKSCA
jgi:hypothetical protein